MFKWNQPFFAAYENKNKHPNGSSEIKWKITDFIGVLFHLLDVWSLHFCRKHICLFYCPGYTFLSGFAYYYPTQVNSAPLERDTKIHLSIAQPPIIFSYEENGLRPILQNVRLLSKTRSRHEGLLLLLLNKKILEHVFNMLLWWGQQRA